MKSGIATSISFSLIAMISEAPRVNWTPATTKTEAAGGFFFFYILLLCADKKLKCYIPQRTGEVVV